MGRYAYHGQEVLKRDGKLVGFNAGYGFYSEHLVKRRQSWLFAFAPKPN